MTEQDGQLFVNQTNNVVQVNTSDMNFEHQPPKDKKSPPQIMVAADINVANIHKRRHNQSECPRGNNRGRLTTKGSNEEQWKSRETKRTVSLKNKNDLKNCYMTHFKIKN